MVLDMLGSRFIVAYFGVICTGASLLVIATSDASVRDFSLIASTVLVEFWRMSHSTSLEKAINKKIFY